MITVISFRKNGVSSPTVGNKKKQAPRTQAQISVQLKVMFVDILIALPLRSNPTQPTRDGFKHLMIGWRKLSANGTAQCVAVSLFLVRIYAASMGPAALLSPLGSGLFKGGTFCRWSRTLIGCWRWRDFFVCTCEALRLVLSHRSWCPRLPLHFLWIFFGGALCFSNLLGRPRPAGCGARRLISIQTPGRRLSDFFFTKCLFFFSWRWLWFKVWCQLGCSIDCCIFFLVCKYVGMWYEKANVNMVEIFKREKGIPIRYTSLVRTY